MAARLTLLLPRLAVLVVIWLLAAASFTFAAGSNNPAQAEPEPKPAPEKPKVLVVPDVRGQTYVFAKGMLEDDGFAWRVEGDVDGYAANTVAVQNPAPGV
ncbi:MAG: PASTA domain-containing protein, partial [Gaiellaceae bacterium]